MINDALKLSAAPAARISHAAAAPAAAVKHRAAAATASVDRSHT
ncbi:hypothetical protein [Mycobacterium parmense]|uniref:Uncharacterized protein n=1 Tax=Mycobacterium parmense TaxID=185642 RepID=A0A7I7YUK6_9MYCO|nr:hypothetical protein [Mycobacterium parmense]BBZ45460.1 hypothetical protein MPRM_27410 [Mycobacterium parmense]